MKERVFFRTTKDMKRKLGVIAKKETITLSYLIRKIILKYLNTEEKQ